MEITGAELFVKALREEQVDTIFAYPGGQAIDLFHALYGIKDIDIILPRHEQGLIHAADGYARSTGKTGVCLVTSGPGATNLVTGIATANYDCVPLVCFTGQVSTRLIGKNSFQEVDTVGITRSICKYTVSVRRREELASIIKRAFYIAQTGKPGVVVVDLPKDIQTAYGDDEYLSHTQSQRRRLCREENVAAKRHLSDSAVPTKQIEKAADILNRAKRPVFLIGGGVKISHAQSEMLQLSETTNIPVITTIMGKGTLPTTHGLYVGNIGIHGSYAANIAVSNCDVLFAIGTRFNDRITGNIEDFAAHATIVHVDIDPSSISRNIKADIPIIADAKKTILSLLKKARPLDTQEWLEQINLWKKQHPISIKTDGISPEKILKEINRIYDNAIITTDVGQNQLWTTQFLELHGQKQLLTSGGFGTMGYGFPAAIGAKIGNPSRDVITITGDGGMQMNIQEMATAVVYELPITICILNNGYLGNVRQWQEMFFDKKYSCTCMRYRKSCPDSCNSPTKHCPEYTPDFIKLAESYGAKGIRVAAEEDVAPALRTAKGTLKVPTVIEFIIGREENVMPIVPPGNALYDMILDTAL